MKQESNIKIWDGVNFREVKESEADALEKADKCQVIRAPMGGGEFKRRDEFSGYETREIKPKKKRASKKKAAKVAEQEKPAAE